MQLFRSEEDVQAWSAATQHSVGAIFGLDQLWQLAQRWYDDRLELGWRRRSVEERQALLEQAELTGEFWQIVL